MKRLNQKYSESGGAVVETALMMMIFVPLMMYVMFIQDAMHHLLSVQEAAISSIWDFSTAPFGVNKTVSNRITQSGQDRSIEKYNRWQFIDHESAYIDVDDPNGMKNDESHHNTPFVDKTWVGSRNDTSYSQYNNKNGSEVVCQRQNDRNFTVARVFGGIGWFGSSFANRGGNYVCWAKGAILNKILPRVFMPEFIKTDVYSGAKYSGGAHSNASSSAQSQADQEQNGGSDLFMFFRARGALLADSWAALSDHLDSHKDYEIDLLWENFLQQQNQNQDFHQRVSPWYKSPLQSLGSLSNILNMGLIELQNTIKWRQISNYKRALNNSNLASTAFVPRPEQLWLTATYSHKGRNYSEGNYMYKPSLNIFGREHFTTSSRDYLRRAGQERTEYYMGYEKEN